MPPFSQHVEVSEQTERACLALLQGDVDQAFAFLRLAEAETHGGKAAHAAELIAKAILARETVLKDLGRMSPSFEEEKGELRNACRRLLEAIRAVERQFRILDA